MNEISSNIKINSFNEILDSQLKELNSYRYDEFQLGHVKFYISKQNFPTNYPKPTPEQIKVILTNIPSNDLKLLSEIYFVSYHCKDDNNYKDIRGRTLNPICKILIYPKVYTKLKIVLTHEIGHVVFTKGFTQRLREYFGLIVQQTFLNAKFNTVIERRRFIHEQFANSYENFINNFENLRPFPLIYNFFLTFVKNL